MRRSQIVRPNPRITNLFEFPTETVILQQWFKMRAINQLIGFENSEKDGKGMYFNFILSNGARSSQRDKWHPTDHTQMIPNDALN